jgi:ubiquitin-protein ligase
MQSLKRGLKTACFNAMLMAVENLKDEAPKYPNVVRRIIVITDGRDNVDAAAALAVLPKRVIEQGIRVDAIVIDEEIDSRLYWIARFSGGSVFRVQTIEDGLAIFEAEAFFNVRLRRFGPRRPLPLPDDWQVTGIGDVDHDVPFIQEDHVRSGEQVVTAREAAIRMDAVVSAPTARVRSIMVQLKTMIANPLPGILVYPFRERIDVWRVLMRGPDDSLYRRSWWYLTIEFPRQYPTTPPVVRFAHPPFHPNISKEGSICISTLDKHYRKDSKIYDILLSILELLAHPNYDDPIDIYRKDLWTNNRDEFTRLVLQSATQNSRRTIDEWTETWEIAEDHPTVPLDVHEYEIPKVFQ